MPSQNKVNLQLDMLNSVKDTMIRDLTSDKREEIDMI
jgi:hypothetical protein